MGRDRLGAFGLLGLGAVLLVAYGAATRHGPALADEFVYLGGARHFAETGGLDARYYDADAILQVGHPHHDVHTPGYVLVLGALTAAVKGGYRTAVALNVVAYLGSALLVRGLALALGAGASVAWAAGALFLVLPATLAYVFWAMPELVLTAVFLASLYVAARWGEGNVGAVATGLLFGLAVLVRESALLAVAAPVALLWGRGRVRAFLATSAVVLLLVYAPLSRNRAPGGANFWAPTSGRAFGYEAVQALSRGRIAQAAELAWARVRSNVEDVVERSPWTERGFLLVFAALPAVALSRRRGLGERERRLVLALVATFGVLVLLLLLVYVLGQWSGFRYLMFLMPAFLPWLPGRSGRGWPLPAAAGALCVALVVGTGLILSDYKVSRQRRQDGLSGYVERYLEPRSVTRIVLPNGWRFGLDHYPVEVISSLPSGGVPAFKALEQAVAFDVLVLPGGSRFEAAVDGRPRYRRLNGSEADPPLLVYRRLR